MLKAIVNYFTSVGLLYFCVSNFSHRIIGPEVMPLLGAGVNFVTLNTDYDLARSLPHMNITCHILNPLLSV